MLKVSLFLISMGAVGASLLATRPVRAHLDDYDRRSNDLTVSAGAADRLDINVPIGEVKVVADNSRQMTVHIVRSAKRPLDSEARRWLNDSYLKAENRSGVLTVRDHPFGQDSLKNVDDHGSNRNGKDLNLEVQIHVPSDLAAKLEVTAGMADVRGRFRSLDAKVAAGVLTTDSVKCSGKMDLHVGAGEVKLTIPSGADQEVSAAVGVGEITGLPEGIKRKEGIHFGDTRRGHTGQGDAKVDVHVGAGSIKVESRDRILANAMPEEDIETVDTDMSDEGDGDGDVDIQVDDKLGETIRKSIELAMKAVHESMGGVDNNIKIDLGDIKFEGLGDLKGLEDLKDLKGLDKDMDKELTQELAKIGPEIEKAMKNFKPDLQMKMKDIKPEIERSMREIKPEVDREIKKAMAEVERMMKTIKPEIEKAMREMKPEIEKAIREAMKEVERAEKELKDRQKAGKG